MWLVVALEPDAALAHSSSIEKMCYGVEQLFEYAVCRIEHSGNVFVGHPNPIRVGPICMLLRRVLEVLALLRRE